IWSYVAELLERPARSRVEVNLSKLNRLAADGDVVLVPGKLLGAGRLDKKVVVAAAYASRAAVEAVLRAGGEVVGKDSTIILICDKTDEYCNELESYVNYSIYVFENGEYEIREIL
ncbi:MAG: 50S ribosomal protein L18e, partial [Candidatus Aramenus sulfurataquae]|nr:50S ribosomal protein L18e [Candidatus Aramenus sulfurataquae]